MRAELQEFHFKETISMTTLLATQQQIKRKTMKDHLIKSGKTCHKPTYHHNHHLHHKHHYRESEIGLLPIQELATRLLEDYLPTIVIDTRDDEVQGGQIRGALFCPERDFGNEQITCLIREATEQRRQRNTGISNHKCFVVFYCRDSERKSLHCAKRFHQGLLEMGEANGICVKVLQGGASSWFEKFGKDKRLVQDFDDKCEPCKREGAASEPPVVDSTANITVQKPVAKA